MQINTQTISNGNSLVITADMNVLQLSIKINSSSTGTLAGDLTIDGTPASAIALAAGDTVNLGTNNIVSPLTGITITCTSGSIDVILSVN